MEEIIAFVRLNEIKKLVRKLEQIQKDTKQPNMKVSMEMVVGSLFPDLFKNFQSHLSQNYIIGFNEGYAKAMEEVKNVIESTER